MTRYGAKFIAAAFVAIATLILGYIFHWWPRVGEFLGERTPIPNWLLGVFGFCVTIVALLIVLLLLAWLKGDEIPRPDWDSYTADYFFGLRWRWRYLEGGQPCNIVPFCPSCDLQLHPQNASPYQVVDRIAFYCENCGHKIIELDESVSSLQDKVARFIQQKLRNGTWRQLSQA